MGDWLKSASKLPDNSVDSIVVDPPYGLEFMGEEWDSFKGTGAGLEEDAKSAGGFGKDSATNENAYAAARVRHGNLFTGRPAKRERQADGINDAFDGALPCYHTGGLELLRFHLSWVKEAFRVLKPGGYLLGFGGSRTYHWLAVAVELTGFEVRDMIEWLYGQGFPKSSNIARAIDMQRCRQAEKEAEQLTGDEVQTRHFEAKLPPEKDRRDGDHICAEHEDSLPFRGEGTALKPAHEPICMARKPLTEKTLAANVLKWGTGGLRIEACEVGRAEDDIPGWHKSGADGTGGYLGKGTFRTREYSAAEIQTRRGGSGRWPANVIMDEEAGEQLNGQSGVKAAGSFRGPSARHRHGPKLTHGTSESNAPDNYGDGGGASRFFYCPKPSVREREAGLDDFAEQQWHAWQTGNGASGKPSSISAERNTKRKNIHPTIKPVSLMRYLVRLVTPVGGTCLDPLMGSASTGVACMMEHIHFIGCEREEVYFKIGAARMEHAMRRWLADEIAKEGTREGLKNYARQEAERAVHSSQERKPVRFKAPKR